MKQFKDCNGVDWQIRVNHAAIKRVQGLKAIDLYEPSEGDPALMVRLQAPSLFADVLYALCLPQAQARNIDSERFGEALDGDAIHAARSAFFEEYRDFFLQLRLPAVAAAIARVTEYFNIVIQSGTDAIAEILQNLNVSPTTSPAPSA